MSAGLIAIVDDDESVRRAMARLLRLYSFQVQAYPSGREFLESLAVKIPDCLIVDLQMNQMTGLELLHHLVGMGLKIPTIVATARDEPAMRHRCMLAGAAAFLVKPVSLDSLLGAIRASTATSTRLWKV